MSTGYMTGSTVEIYVDAGGDTLLSKRSATRYVCSLPLAARVVNTLVRSLSRFIVVWLTANQACAILIVLYHH